MAAGVDGEFGSKLLTVSIVMDNQDPLADGIAPKTSTDILSLRPPALRS